MAAPAAASQSEYIATLSGGAVVPPSGSPATGFVDVKINFATQEMTVHVPFSGLSAPATAAHIHCCVAAGTNAIVATFNPSFPIATSGTYDNIFDMTAAGTYSSTFIADNGETTAQAFNALVAGLNGGDAYFDIHSTVFPGGEIRGQLQLLPPPTLQSAVSRKSHGAAGTFDLPLSAVATNPTTEPRQGPGQTIVFTFDKTINAATATVTEGAAVAGAPTFSGNDVIVSLTGVSNRQYVTVALSNVSSSEGGLGGSGSVRLGFLLGDVNQNRVVSVSDLGLVNAQLAQVVTAANYLRDVNASGTLSVADKAITNANLTRNLPAP